MAAPGSAARSFRARSSSSICTRSIKAWGSGEKLFDGARVRLAELRLKGLLVWALADNDSACGFYLSLGGKPVAEGAESFGDVSLRKVAFAWA